MRTSIIPWSLKWCKLTKKCSKVQKEAKYYNWAKHMLNLKTVFSTCSLNNRRKRIFCVKVHFSKTMNLFSETLTPFLSNFQAKSRFLKGMSTPFWTWLGKSEAFTMAFYSSRFHPEFLQRKHAWRRASKNPIQISENSCQTTYDYQKS